MSNDISRVYQFLAKQGDWVSAADSNNDGTVIKSEFKNFMEENFEWDGEITDAGKNDLINTFWNKIDSNQSGKISGTKLKNKNALDSKEIDAMNDRIEIYEILNDYTSNISAPSVVPDSSDWKKSVSESLANLVEQYIQEGGNADGLEAFLNENIGTVTRKTTADKCAYGYIKNNLGNVLGQYKDYTYNSDDTLKGIIDAYVSQVAGDETVTDADIKAQVEEIINAYIATAGLSDESNSELLAEFGYNANGSSNLNELQKSIVKQNINNALAEVENLEDYDKNSEIYENAISAFIDSVIAGATFDDFEEIKNYGMAEFEASQNYQNAKNSIATKEIFNSEEFKTAITREIGASFADRLSGIMSGEIEAYDNILAEALTEVQNGNFVNANGELDKNKLIDWIIDKLQNSMAEFYPNGLGDIPLEELGTTYDALVNSAKEQGDASKVKEAAIMYCDALCEKSTALAKAVEDIFGSDYASKINNLLTSEIDKKITELKLEAEKIGDISTFTLSSLNTGIADNQVVLDTGTSSSHTLNATVMNGEQTIDQSRISFSATSSNSGVICSLDNNTLTIQGAQAGSYTIEVQVLVDNVPIGETQTISITVKQSNADIINNVTGWNGATVEHLEALKKADGNNLGNQVTEEDFADLYNSDVNIVLHWAKDNNGNGWTDSGVQDKIRDRLQLLGTAVVSALSTAGLDSTKLNTAVNTVIDRYINQGTKYYKKNKGDTPANCYNIMKDDRVSTQSYIVNVRDTNGKDSNIYAIHFKDFVDDILEEYWKLAG